MSGAVDSVECVAEESRNLTRVGLTISRDTGRINAFERCWEQNSILVAVMGSFHGMHLNKLESDNHSVIGAPPKRLEMSVSA